MQPPTEITLPVRKGRAALFSPLLTLLVLTFRQHIHGRRLYILAGLFLLPLALAVLLRSVGAGPTPSEIEFALLFNLIPHALAPLTALLYASGMIQDEIEGQTLTYLLMRPLPRTALYLTKLLGTFLMTTLLMTGGVAIVYVAIYWGEPGFWDTILPQRLPRVVAVLALGQATYCALFGAFMLLIRRSVLAGVIYIVTVEGILANVGFLVRRLTVVYYERVLFLTFLDAPARFVAEWREDWAIDLTEVPSVQRCIWTLVGASIVIALLSAWRFSRREFALKTPEGN